MHRNSRRHVALLAVIASAALGTVLTAPRTDAAGPGELTLSATAKADRAGDAIGFAFTVSNVDAGPLTGVSLAVSAFTGTGAAPTITCPQADLPVGVTEICTADYGLTATDMGADTVTLTAAVAGTDGNGDSVTGPSADAAFAVQHPTFIDSPDITNDDIGDLNKLPGGAAVVQSYGNSWDQAAENSVDWAYHTIASYQPANYLISGDLTEGRWGEPGDASGLFGPQSDPATRIQNMADFYQGDNVRRLKDAGLYDKLYAIPGDHDYGDNWWRVDDPTGYGKTKYDNFDIWRNAFYHYYDSNPDGLPRFTDTPTGTQWDKTAYATMISPDMLLVSVDVFDRLDNTDNVGNKVALGVVDGQLDWFKQVLAQARSAGSPVKWIVVQGHVPVLTPVRVSHSSGLHLAGRTTAFWQAMKQYKVNLYLAGEVHATSRRSLNGITQITTGAPLEYTGQTTFVAVNEYPDHLGLVDWGWNVPENAPNPPSWDGACGVSEIEANSNACPPGRVVSMNYDYSGYQPTVEGTLDINDGNSSDYGTGNLIEYVNPPAPTSPAEHAAISLRATASSSSVPAGADSQIAYALRVSNSGNVALSTVSLTEAAFNGHGVMPTVTCPQDSLPVGVSETCSASYTVTRTDLAGTAITDTVTGSGVAPSGAVVSSLRKTSAVALAASPALSVSTRTGTASISRAGAKITYSYGVDNTGNTTLSTVRMRRPERTGTGTWSAIACPSAVLAAGAEMTCTGTYTPSQADIDHATVITSTTAADGTDPAGDTASSNISRVRTPVNQLPSLTLTEKANVTAVAKAGQKIVYRFIVKDTGNLTLRNLTVAATVSGKGTRSGYTYPTRTLTPGASTTVRMSYTVARADISRGRVLVTAASAHGQRAAGADRTVSSNRSLVRVAVR